MSRTFLVFGAFTVIAVGLLWNEHRVHLLGALPYLILLACPLLHLFMHGGHHRRRRGGAHRSGETNEGDRP